MQLKITKSSLINTGEFEIIAIIYRPNYKIKIKKKIFLVFEVLDHNSVICCFWIETLEFNRIITTNTKKCV